MKTKSFANTIQEHLWFTATTLGFNWILLSSSSLDEMSGQILKILSAIVTIFAAFLIIDRAGNAFWKKHEPTILKRENRVGRYALPKSLAWGIYRVFMAIAFFPFIICEIGSPLFYLLLIILSSAGVFVVR